MRTLLWKIVAVICILISFCPMTVRAAQKVVIADVCYIVDNGVASCKCENVNVGLIDIQPAITIHGVEIPVTSIKDGGFEGCKALVSVEIPGSIQTIGKRAFANCKKLTSIKIPNSVTYVGFDAFLNCKSLTSVVLPDNATYESEPGFYGYGGKGPFAGCSSLVNVSGNTVKYPRSALSKAFVNCDEVPFTATIDLIISGKQNDRMQSDMYVTGGKEPSSAGTTVTTPETVATVNRASIVDIDIPRNNVINKNTFAVIIGNEKYQRLANVSYALNDATVFSEYCMKTLGLPKNNIRMYCNATLGDFITAINDITDISKAFKGDINLIFYYSGHGVPEESSANAFLVPVDASATNMDACYPLSKLYLSLNALNTKSTVVFLDACFSGSERGNNMLVSAKGVAIKAKETIPEGNVVVFTASSGDQTAFPMDDKQHGIFTYFLLDKIRDTKGDVTLGDLSDYLMTNVAQQSVVVNHKVQIPTVSTSSIMIDKWKSQKLIPTIK